MSTVEPYTGIMPEGWSGGEPVTKRYAGNFIHLYHVTRPCVGCGGVIGLDVTKNALLGTKKNAGLLMRRCPTCREAKRAGVGSRGGTSRPVVDVPGRPPVVEGAPMIVNELETLLAANRTMTEELHGLYLQNRELRERLAKYELAPAMELAAQENKLPWG